MSLCFLKKVDKTRESLCIAIPIRFYFLYSKAFVLGDRHTVSAHTSCNGRRMNDFFWF